MFENIVFSKLANKNIFSNDFKIFNENNELSFSEEGICVVYGPNGTGKTSLINTLSKQPGTEFSFSFRDKTYTNESKESVVFVINDQNNRNIISGGTQDFLLGDNIKREYELKQELEDAYGKIVTSLITVLKQTYQISSKSSKLITLIEPKLFIEDIVNSRSKGKNFNIDKLISLAEKISIENPLDFEETKFNFFAKDFNEKSSIIEAVLNLSTSQITINAKVHEIEENDEAIKLLGRFINKTECIVCDTKDIDPALLIEKKKSNRDSIIQSMDKKLKTMIESAIEISPLADPFEIKKILLNAINNGEFTALLKLQEELKIYKLIFQQKISLELKKAILVDGLTDKNKEYQIILSEKPQIEEEDIFYIQEIISKSMDKELDIVRDGNRNIRILLSKQEFINVEREALPLSAGEQNFLSLMFEFLKAKNSAAEIIVIDDPISSFDSIYKNKIVFSLVRMLSHKKRLVLTHNLDLVRLLNGQYQNCFNLYILENSTGATAHGFIPLKKEEKEMLIDLNKLLTMFREEIFEYIENPQAYLLSMIPFMRGYAHIIDNKEAFNKLTAVMHGYKTEKVDIAQIYFELFGDKGRSYLRQNYNVSVEDILSFNIDTVNIIKNSLPLLNKTLKHTFTYLYLRLLVEKTLVEKYKINTERHCQLGDILVAAFKDDKKVSTIRSRVFLTSKKTLINEFNHFEGNLSIFQPAIDITDTALVHEKAEITTFVDKLKTSKS